MKNKEQLITNFPNAVELAKKEIIQKGIGTLSEKILHRTLKYLYEENDHFHEIKVGSFYADIKVDNQIYEIQTRQFNRLREKLDAFLIDNNVTIIYPVFPKKYLIWLDPESGETENKRKSPRKGNIYDALSELYKIKFYLDNKNLSLNIVSLEIDEYRNLDGWNKSKKRGSTRYLQVPNKIIDIVPLEKTSDYSLFIPDDLPLQFTVKDYHNKTKLNAYKSQIAINVLKYLKVIKQCGKEQRAFIYERNY